MHPFTGVIAFILFLMLAITLMMLSECTRSPLDEPPPRAADGTRPSVGADRAPSPTVHDGPIPSGAAHEPTRQPSSGFDIGSWFDDAKKSVTSAVGGGSGACGNDPAILGEWTSASRNTLKITFDECVESVSQLNGCSGTYSYSAKGGVVTGKLMTVKPSICGAIGSTSMANYKIEGSILTIQEPGKGVGKYHKGSAPVAGGSTAADAAAAKKTGSGFFFFNWWGRWFDLSAPPK